MTVYEPASNQILDPDATVDGVMECRIYIFETTEVDGREVISGIDLNTFEFVSFFVDEMQNVRPLDQD